MAAVAPRVRPGATMLELVEEVEHALRSHGSRVPSFTTHVFTGFGEGKSSADETRTVPVEEGDVVMFDFGAVVDGYCSDFGRTVCVGEPEDGGSHRPFTRPRGAGGGRAALRPACSRARSTAPAASRSRRPGTERLSHRMGTESGSTSTSAPSSPRRTTPLEAGMTFTDEPSILVDGRFGVRTEDVVVCEPDGGRKLNRFPPDLIVNR